VAGRAVAVPLDEGGTVLIEIADDCGEVPFGKAGDRVVTELSQSLQKSLAPVRGVAQAFIDQFALMAQRPEAITVQFAVEFDAAAQLMIARAGTKANFQISVEWRGGGKTGPAAVGVSSPEAVR
jgi:hypothetical protein